MEDMTTPHVEMQTSHVHIGTKAVGKCLHTNVQGRAGLDR